MYRKQYTYASCTYDLALTRINILPRLLVILFNFLPGKKYNDPYAWNLLNLLRADVTFSGEGGKLH